MQLLKIDLGMIDKLNSGETRSVTDPINIQFEELFKEVGNLKGTLLAKLAKLQSEKLKTM